MAALSEISKTISGSRAANLGLVGGPWWMALAPRR